MVLTRINLKLIKCDFWLDFILFQFFKENNKKIFFFMASYLLFWKKIPEIWSMKNSKKKKRKNSQKTSLFSAVTWITFLVRKTLKFGFLYFYKSCRELNFLSKNINPESIGFLRCKLWPKYETGAEDNTNSALSSIFSQNFKWVQRQICSSLSNRLILSLCFRRNIFEK